MKDRKKIIENLVALRDGWNSLSKQMTWAFRRAEKEPPPIFVLTTGMREMPSRAEWVSMRREVILARRRAGYENKQRRIREGKERRRDYMRGYMRRYRKETNA
jgi:hypothetical protein